MNKRNFKSMSDEKLIKEMCIRTQTCDDYVLAKIEFNKRRKRKEILMIILTIAILILTLLTFLFTAVQFYKPNVDSNVQRDDSIN